VTLQHIVLTMFQTDLNLEIVMQDLTQPMVNTSTWPSLNNHFLAQAMPDNNIRNASFLAN